MNAKQALDECVVIFTHLLQGGAMMPEQLQSRIALYKTILAEPEEPAIPTDEAVRLARDAIDNAMRR